jgi:D-glycero-D-manno-heptose 1,7-bisphosphate phosphatase
MVRNGKPHPPASLKELEILPGVPGALTTLQEANFLLFGVTNQPDVARGAQRREVVESINAALLAALPLTDMFVCYHDDQDQCSCRKPQPGLLLKAAQRYPVSLLDSFMVGDRWRDVEAGRRAGCRTVFVDYHYAEKAVDIAPDCQVASLAEAVPWILQQAAVTKGG